MIRRMILLRLGTLLTFSLVFIGTARSASVDRALVGKWQSKGQDRNQRPGQERLLLWQIEANGASTMSIFNSESGDLSTNSERWGIRPSSGGVELAHGTYSLRAANAFTTVDAGMPYGSVTWTKQDGNSAMPGIDTCLVDTIRESPSTNAAAFNSALIGLWRGSAVKTSGDKVAMLWRVGRFGATVRITLLNSFPVPVGADAGQITTTFPNEPPVRDSYRMVSRDQFELTNSGQRSTWARCN